MIKKRVFSFVKIAALFLPLISTLSSYSQTFEGKIVYRNIVTSKIPTVSDLKLGSMMGSVEEYFIKAGSYKIVTNGNFLQWEIYNNSGNRLYIKNANSDSAYWKDAAVDKNPIVRTSINKNVRKILGYSCNEIVMICKSSVEKYYYSSKLPVDPQKFVGHNYNHWYEYLKRTRSIPLMIVVNNDQFTLQSTATSVSSMKFDSVYFSLPLNAVDRKQ